MNILQHTNIFEETNEEEELLRGTGKDGESIF